MGARALQPCCHPVLFLLLRCATGYSERSLSATLVNSVAEAAATAELANDMGSGTSCLIPNFSIYL